MKNIKYLLFITLFIAQTRQGFCQHSVALVHGFGDNDGTWDVYQPHLQALLGTSNPVSTRGYSFNNGVQGGINTINLSGGMNAQSIAIGQSMGGVVIRERDRQLPNQNYGGLITLGSPNRGGTLLTGIRDGTVQAELEDGCNEIRQALAATSVALGFLGINASVSISPLGQTRTSLFSSRLCDNVMTIVNNNIPDLTNQTLVDLSENSGLLTNLNNSNTPTFKIGVYGVEESPVHMRLFGSFINDPAEQSLGVSNTDEDMVSLFHDVQDIVLGAEITFLFSAIGFTIGGFTNPSLFPIAAVCLWASYEWSNVRTWLDQSESSWHAMIGAGGFYTEKRLVRGGLTASCQARLNEAFAMYYNGTISNYILPLLQNIIYLDPNCYENVVLNVSLPINYESDGFFNAGTQRIPNDPFDPTHVINRRVERVNHREFYNHSSMTQEFRDIFEGRSGANNFFKLL